MGEIADMMLDGTLCAGCGVFLDREPEGYPIYCAACSDEAPRVYSGKGPKPKIKCSVCGKRVKEIGLADHMRDVHGSEAGGTQ